ncbi:MAG: hypothetical protein RL760_1485 [Candidatus Eisenbacteria bacterium]
MTHRRAWRALALCVLLAPSMSVAAPARVALPTAPVALGAARASIGRVDGVPMIAGNDLARVLAAAKTWRSDVRKLVLQVGAHRLTFTVDNPFVLADDRTLQLANSVVMRSGEVQVPLDLLARLPQDDGWPRLRHDPATQVVWAAPARGMVGPPEVERRDDRTVLTLTSESADEARVLARGRARFRLRLTGVFTGVLPDSLPDGGLVHDVAVSAVPGGIVFEFAVAPEANGWRLERDAAAGRVRLVFATRGDSLQTFASERGREARPLRTVVLDPGHGGSEAGVRAEGAVEKDLALDLAGRLALALQRRGVAQVLLTRSDDRERPQPERAELANRARADAVIALHFETWPDARAEGAVVWCAPGTGVGDEAPLAPGMVAVRPWRDAGLDRASESRQLADAVAAALDRHGYGPARVRERMPFPLLGMQSPGLMIACGNLARAEDRARFTAPGGLDALADALAEGVVAWSRE